MILNCKGRLVSSCVAAVVMVAAQPAIACRGGRSGPDIPVATFAQALNPRLGEVSFIGKVVERQPNLKVKVFRRIQGYTPELATVVLWCVHHIWGKEGDIIPVIAVYDESLLLGIGSNYHIGSDGKYYRGRDIALTIDEMRRLHRYRFSR